MHACVSVRESVHVCMSVCVCMCVQMCVRIYKCVCVCTYKYDRTNKITKQSVESNGGSQASHLLKKTIHKETFS